MRHRGGLAQQRVIDAIRAHISEHRCSPTLQDIANRAGLSAASTVKFHIDNLSRLGLVQYEPGRSRTIRLTGAAQ